MCRGGGIAPVGWRKSLKIREALKIPLFTFQFSSLSLATVISIVTIVIMTVIAELNAGFKGFLADLTGHHWVSKGLLAMGLFLVLWLISALGLRGDSQKIKMWALTTVIISLFGVLAIYIFFWSHFLAA